MFIVLFEIVTISTVARIRHGKINFNIFIFANKQINIIFVRLSRRDLIRKLYYSNSQVLIALFNQCCF